MKFGGHLYCELLHLICTCKAKTLESLRVLVVTSS